MAEKITFKKVYRISFYLTIIFLILLAVAEYQYAIKPCILSYGERIVFFVLMLTFWTSSLYEHTKKTKGAFNWFGFIVSMIGVAIVSRHLWIQRVTSGFGISLIDKNKPLVETLKQSFLGIPPGCHQIYELFLGVRIIELVLAAFVFFAIICFWQQFRD